MIFINPIPPSFINYDIVQQFINTKPLYILRLPLLDMDYDLAYNAVRTVLNLVKTSGNGYSPLWYDDIFRDCPHRLKDAELCQEAYAKNKVLTVFMPEKHITYNMVYELSLLKDSDWSIYNTLDRIPKQFQNYQICENYVTNISGCNIKHVPENIIDQNLCNLAFNQNANCFENIPDKFKTYQMCLKATKNVDVTISWLKVVISTPPHFRTDEFWNSYHLKNENFKRYSDLCNHCQCNLCH